MDDRPTMNYNSIVNNIISHPSFRETLNRILDTQTGLQSPSVSSNEAHSHQGQGSIQHSIDVQEKQRIRPSGGPSRFQTPAEEFRELFNRGGSSVPRSNYCRGRSYSASGVGRRRGTGPYNRPNDRLRSASATSRPSSGSVARASTIFQTKEVVLLNSKSESEVLRGAQKASLMERGVLTI